MSDDAKTFRCACCGSEVPAAKWSFAHEMCLGCEDDINDEIARGDHLSTPETAYSPDERGGRSDADW